MKIIYFAKIREIIGKSEEDMEISSDIETVDELLDYLISLGERYKIALYDKDSIHVACDEDHVKKDFKIKDKKEIAIFPPVTGG